MMITTLTGSNKFKINKYIDDQKHNYLDKYGEFSIEQIDCEEASLERILDALQSLPFLAPSKLLIVNNPSKNKEFVAILQSRMNMIPETIKVLISEPKLDKRAVFYKFLKSYTEYLEFGELEGDELVRWVEATARNRKGIIDVLSAKYLIEQTGPDQTRLTNEVQKLIAYSSTITKETVDLLVNKPIQSSVFDLIEAALCGKTERALKLYEEQRQLGVDPQQIVGILSWQLNILVMIKSAANMSPNEIAKISKISPYVISKSSKLVSKMSYKEIKDYINTLYNIDIKFKTKTADLDNIIQSYIMTYTKNS